MPNLKVLSDSFLRYIDRFYNCAGRIEQQLAAGKISITDIDLFYASAFLSAHTRWEAFLEDSLIEVCCGKPSTLRSNFRLAEFRSKAVLRRILLFPEKNYISLATLKQLAAISELLVNEGRPFSQISERNRTLIQQAGWIRNAIAHRSDYSMSEFRDKVPGVSSLPRNRRLPGAFLRHVFRVSPTQRRFEIYFTAFKSASTEVTKAWK